MKKIGINKLPNMRRYLGEIFKQTENSGADVLNF